MAATAPSTESDGVTTPSAAIETDRTGKDDLVAARPGSDATAPVETSTAADVPATIAGASARDHSAASERGMSPRPDGHQAAAELPRSREGLATVVPERATRTATNADTAPPVAAEIQLPRPAYQGQSDRTTASGAIARARIVAVKSGDSLFSIILETYGRYDHSIQRVVMRSNPQLQDPDRIFVGQILRLPAL